MSRWRFLTLAGVALVAWALPVSGCGGYGDDGSTSSSAKSPIAGHWTGRLHEQGLSPFTVAATIASPTGSAGNEVHYTGIDCSGRWTYLDSDGTTYRFREVIHRGDGGKCKGVGVVTLTADSSADRLGYQFRGGGIVSRGTLHHPHPS